MAKTSKKALGATMAGVMAIGAVAGTVGAVQEVRAGVAEDMKLIDAKLQHFNYSLKKNYLGLKNVGQWQQYERELKTLIGKLPEGSAKAGFQARLDVCVSLLNAAAKVNHVEKSLDTNFHGIKNAETWSVYLKDGQDLLNKVDKELEGRKAELVERLAKAKATVDGIINTYKKDLSAATALYNEAVTSKNLEAAKKALAAAEALGTHSTSDELEAKCKKLIEDLSKTTAITEVKAVGAKKIEVKFNKAVDSAKAELTVKKGSVKVNASSVTYSADKTSAVIELAGKLTKGEYTVLVSGVGTDAITKSVSVEDEKVAKVAVLSDKAIATADAVAGVVADATVGYSVENQYGEDITKTTSLTASSSQGNPGTPANGVVTLTGVNAKVNDKVVLTLIHAESATTTTATLTVSAKSVVAEASVSGIYNVDKKVLNEKTDLATDKFYLVVDAKDQYGKVIDAPASADVIITNSNSAVVTVPTTIKTVKIDGKDKSVIELAGPVKAGSTVVNMISKSTGKASSFTVNVAEGVRVGKVTLSQPEMPVAGEDMLVPVSAVDKAGNAITSVKLMKEQLTATYGGTAATIVEKNGAMFIQVPKAAVVEGVNVLVVTNTVENTVDTLQVSVKKAAVATTIVGVKSTVDTTGFVAGTSQIGIDELVIQDQYGREITTTAAKIAALTGLTIETRTVSGNANTIAISGSVNVADATGKITVTNVAKGSDKVLFVLAKGGTEIASSAKEVSFRVTDGTEYKSYIVEDIKTVFDGGTGTSNDYDRQIKAYGVLNDGSKVALTYGTDFSVVTEKAIDGAADNTIDSATIVQSIYAKDATEATVKAVVTINATGEQIVKDIKVSKEAPKVVAGKVVATAQATDATSDVLKSAYDKLTAVSSMEAGTAIFNKGKLENKVITVDQYDVYSNNKLANSTMTFTNFGDSEVTGNGAAASAATITLGTKATGADAKIVFNSGFAINFKLVK